jgi:bifunctional non-homologous end joining protein LigD
MTTHPSASLHYCEGPFDKVYHAAIEPQGEGYLVTFAYGRRGQTLNTGTKTTRPVPLDQAERIFEKLVQSKLAKGYRHTHAQAAPSYHPTDRDGQDSGIRCQLLNPIEAHEVSHYIRSPQYCLQQKHDGRRLLVRKQGNTITGINRRGLIVALPEPIRKAVADHLCDVLLDGEAVGETLHAFDLLEFNGSDLRHLGFLERFQILTACIPPRLEALRWISTVIGAQDKLETYEELRATHREGVVFKDIHAPHSAGRPNSGGPQLKFKFVESASFIVAGRNGTRRSVGLELITADGKRVPAGNVTIPPNHEVPDKGSVVEVRYLYAHRPSGSIYQPTYLAPRTDIPPTDCTVDQLKFKPD